MSDEAGDILASAGITPDQAGVTERDEHGYLVAGEIMIQCHGCLERGLDERAALLGPLQFHNGMSLDDLRIECPRCTQATGVSTVIPIGVFVGADADEVDVGLDLLDHLRTQQEGGGAAAGDSGPPFAGVGPGQLSELPKPPEK